MEKDGGYYRGRRGKTDMRLVGRSNLVIDRVEVWTMWRPQ